MSFNPHHPLTPSHRYVPYTPEAEALLACGVPTGFNASKEWADKKVVLFAVPGMYGLLPSLIPRP